MKKTSVLMVIFLLLSSFGAYAQIKFYDGEASLTVNGSDNFLVETADGFAGKPAEDKVYKITGKGTNYGANYVEPGLAGFQSSGSVEYSLLFEDEASVHTIAVNYYNESKANGGGANNIFKFSPGYDYVKADAGNSNLGAFKFELNKWYRIAIDYTYTPDSSTTGLFAVYINGVKIGSWRYNYVANGVRRLALGCTAKEDGTNSVIYMDNITSYLESDEDFDSAKSTPSEITSTGDTISLNGGIYVVPENCIVQSFKESIVTTDSDDVVRLFDASLASELSDADTVGDAVAVIAAKNGREYETAYTYYTVTNECIEEDTDLFKGTEALSVSGITLDSSEGDFGKEASDKVYRLPLVAGSASANYINLPAGDRLARIMEMAFLLPEADGGIRIDAGAYTASSGSAYSAIGAITIKPGEGGFKYKVFSTTGTVAENIRLESGKWYCLAMEFPADGQRDFNVYINGELAISDSLNFDCYGMRHIRVSSISGSDATMTAAYLDNIRSSSTVSYSYKKDIPPQVGGDGITCAFESGTVKVKKGVTAGELTDSITKDIYTFCRVYDSDRNILNSADELVDGDILVAATTNRRTVERAYEYYTVNAVSRIAPALTSDVYDLGETVSIMPYTTLEAFEANVTLDSTCALTVSSGETVYQKDDILSDGGIITVTDSVTGEILQSHTIKVNSKAISDNFDLMSAKMYTGGTSSDGNYSFSGPKLSEGYAPEDYAYIEAVDIPGRGRVIHSYSDGSHSAESGRVHMNLGSKTTPGKAELGSRFAIHTQVMLPKSNDVYAVLTSYKTKDGTNKNLQVTLQLKDGSVSLLGSTVGAYETGEWTDILLLCDTNDGTVVTFINNTLASEITVSNLKDFDYFTNMRPVHHIYQSGKVNESYLACFEVFGIGSVCDKLISDNNTSLASESYTVSDGKINGFIGMTASDIRTSAQITDGASIMIYESDGKTEVIDSAEIQNGMLAVVTSASGTSQVVYPFGAEHCDVGEIQILVNGGANFEKFVSGTITASVEVENFCNTSYPITVAIAHYSDEKLLNVEFTTAIVTKGKQNVSADIEILNTSDTHIKAFVFSSLSDIVPLKKSVRMVAFSADSIEDVRILYPGYTEKAVTFSYDDLISTDERLIGIFDDNGIKGTFNLMTNRFADTDTAVLKSRYEGHEIASHSYSHPRMYITKDTVIDGVTYTPLTYDEVTADIQKAQDDIKALTGSVPIGFAWPYARASSRSDYAEILSFMQDAGIRYTRSVTSTYAFDLPENWMEWDPTCHHNEAVKYTEDFMNLEENGTLKLLYIWGHSYEFASSDVMTWDGITAVCEALGKDESIWKATNEEIYNYIEATKQISTDYDNGTITNNSSEDVYLAVNSVNICVPANSQFTIK